MDNQELYQYLRNKAEGEQEHPLDTLDPIYVRYFETGGDKLHVAGINFEELATTRQILDTFRREFAARTFRDRVENLIEKLDTLDVGTVENTPLIHGLYDGSIVYRYRTERTDPKKVPEHQRWFRAIREIDIYGTTNLRPFFEYYLTSIESQAEDPIKRERLVTIVCQLKFLWAKDNR